MKQDNVTHLPPSPTRAPGQTRVEAGLEHPTLDPRAQQEAEDREQEESHDKLVAGRVPF